MLSILIPIYNFDVRPLVQALHRQGEESGVPFEICCFDDCSELAFRQKNAAVDSLAHVNYQTFSKNKGRSAIRNTLAKAAEYDYLLFMDCDSKVVRADYLQTYLSHLQADTVLYGGRVYRAQPPEDVRLRLHWHYGREREQTTASERKQHSYHSFMTNNFLIPKAVFERIGFDESLRQYGHEDTLFGLELRRRNIPVLHLDNPLEHLGLESADTFLRKTEQAVENLHQLWQSGKLTEARLLHFFEQCRRLYLIRPLHALFQLAKPWLQNYFLRQHKTKLWLFDFYKLGIFMQHYYRV